MSEPKRRRKAKATARTARTSARSIKRAERIRLALKHRVAGLTFPEIGEAMGCATSTAYDLVRDGLADIPREDADQLRTLTMRRLEALLPKQMEKGVKGDVRAVDAAIKIIDAMCRLNGLDRMNPVRVAVVSDAGEEADEPSPLERIKARIAALASANDRAKADAERTLDPVG